MAAQVKYKNIKFSIQTDGSGQQTHTIIASWAWANNKTKEFAVRWDYAITTNNKNLWLIGKEETVRYPINKSTYTWPDEAYKVRFYVKPIAKTEKRDGKDTTPWTGIWSPEKVYWIKNQRPPKPTEAPEIIDITPDRTKYTVRVRFDPAQQPPVNKIKKVIFREGYTQSGKGHYSDTGRISLNADGYASVTFPMTNGTKHKYKYRYVDQDGQVGLWSDYSNYIESKLNPVRNLTATIIKENPYGTDPNEVMIRLEWGLPIGSIVPKQFQYQYISGKGNNRWFDTGDDVHGSTVNYSIDRRLSVDIRLTKGNIYYFRVRSEGTEDNQASTWQNTSIVIDDIKPNPPTVWSSNDSSKLDPDEWVDIFWQHNSKSGSIEKSAKVDCYISAKLANGSYSNPVTCVSFEYSVDDDQLYSQNNTFRQIRFNPYYIDNIRDPEASKVFFKDVDNKNLDIKHPLVSNINYIKIADIPKDWPSSLISNGFRALINISTKNVQSDYGPYSRDISIIFNSEPSVKATLLKSAVVIGEAELRTSDDMTVSQILNKTNNGVTEEVDMDMMNLVDLGSKYYIDHILDSQHNFVLHNDSLLIDDLSGVIYQPLDYRYFQNEPFKVKYCFINGKAYILGKAVKKSYIDEDGNQQRLLRVLNLNDSYSHPVPEESLGVDVFEFVHNVSLYDNLLQDDQIIYFYINDNKVNVILDESLEQLAFDIVDKYPIQIGIIASPLSQKVTTLSIDIIADQQYKFITNAGENRIINKDDTVYHELILNPEDGILTDFNRDLYPKDITLANGINYRLSVSVVMDSGLSANHKLPFFTSFDDNDFQVVASIDMLENYIAYIYPHITNNEDLKTPLLNEDDYLLSVYRINMDGSLTVLDEKKQAGTGHTFIDKHPTLSTMNYRIVGIKKQTGTIVFSDINKSNDGDSIIINWDEEIVEFDYEGEDEAVEQPYSGNILRLPYDIEISDSHSNDVSLVEYIGRENPVSYYGTQKSHQATWNAKIPKDDTNTLAQIRRLAAYAGNCYVREPSGSGYWANISVSYNQKYDDLTIPISFNIVKVEGGG